jgi:spore cortex formation protein SpoVR/YcgB (stage V sporulation)
MLRHVARLWGYDVRIESVDETGKVELVGECLV